MRIAARLTNACLLAVGVLLISVEGGVADDSGIENEWDEIGRLSARIDAHIEDHYERNNITPAARSDDAEFFRRVSLDLSGKIPHASEAIDFLENTDPDKRRKAVDRLLESPGYVTHFTTFWRNAMLPEVNADYQIRFLVPGFEAWLRQQLTENRPYDELVQEILTTELETPRGEPDNRLERFGEASPLAFYQAKQIAPENLAAASSRIFLGIRIECAQCHDHPFDDWKRDEFWQFAAFFAGIERDRNRGIYGEVRELFDRREINVPDTERVVQAGYLDGTQPQWQFRIGPRETLANWITASENPYFARATVNRLWGHFFGVGLVDPLDDFSAANPPSHPDLLDLLAREFTAHDFDLKFLIRAVTASDAYQLSSEKSDDSQDDPRLFARMAVRGLTPEQVFDSVAQAIGYHEPYRANRSRSIDRGGPRGEFLEAFGNDADFLTERQTTILQALMMMNGGFVTRGTDPSDSRTLAAIVEFPRLSTDERIERMYFAVLSRPPRAEELQRLVRYVEEGGANNDPRQAYSDIFWALLNSSEFLFNH